MINRRVVLGGLAAAAVFPSLATAAPAHTMNHGKATPLSDAAGVCVVKGEACLQHCLGMFAMGDASMAACGQAVSAMLATARAVMTLALAGSKHTKAAAQVAMAAAKDCEAECKKYSHEPCKACAECCAKFIAEAAKA